MADLVITGVPKRDIPLIWNQVEPLVNKALATGRGELWACDVLTLLLSGDMQLWAAFDGQAVKAICITEIVTFPRLKICRVAYVAGSGMRAWLGEIDLIKAWAKSHGCQEIWGGGRKGWSRVLGWEPGYQTCALKLEN